MQGNKPSKKKQLFSIGQALTEYLKRQNRFVHLPVQYKDLLRYEASTELLNQNGENTYWETVYFQEYERQDLYDKLTRIYSLLKADGDLKVLEHLAVARVDFCTFGNTKPFRIRIINRLNDNYDHFYIKKADASRVYGLELEYLLSPNSLSYLVDGETLIEEHIAGIPGDDFMISNLQESDFNQIRMAKEFIKFNERCFVRLLGDMRAYNYVIDITPDIEGNQYRIRAIDFDQQSYEGRKNFYLPQYFKENNPIIFLGIKHMAAETVRQYQLEERSLIAGRVKASLKQVNDLFDVMTKDEISQKSKVLQLREELAYHHKNDVFKKHTHMGELVFTNIKLLLQKDFRQSIVFKELRDNL